MRAVVIDDFGALAALADLPKPQPETGEVLVRVSASSINGFDVAVAGSMLQGMMDHRFPVVLGKDFAGVVEAVGDQASRFTVGDEVFGVVMKPYLGDGGFGEYLCVEENNCVTRPPAGLSAATAGALGLAATAAFNAVAAVAPTKGETVLVAGATGGVGAYAVQMLAASGAEIIATAKPGAETDFVRDLGAAQTVDYTGDVAAQVRRLAPDGVNAVLHFAGDGSGLVPLLATGGRLASTLGFGPDAAARADIAVTAVMANPDVETLDQLAADTVAGRLRVPVTRSYSLAEVPQALTDFAAGSIGKLAVTFD
ncbi:NADP-dependent oxidoreductase [Kribbella sp. CA-245084]|uniref:NADP-dependent oxidoreductase n=1 Tax=Kribbella sp. CA-245084 TaxID=3239940 RepID=UPI003D8DEF10